MDQPLTAALVTTYAGPPANFTYATRARPRLRAREIEVEVTAASVNPLDLLMANGYGRRLFGLGSGGRLPFQAGRDGAGLVTRVGSRVTHLKPGTPVWFALSPFIRGSYATHIQIDGSLAQRAPAQISLTEAASLPYTGVMALRLLAAAGLDEDSSRSRRIFIHGASGGIGFVLLDLLRAWGASVRVSASPEVFDVLLARAPCTCFDSRSEEILKGISQCDTLFNLVAPNGESVTTDERRLIGALPEGGYYVTPNTPLLSLLDEFGMVEGGIRALLYRQNARREANPRKIHYRWVFFRPNADLLVKLATYVAHGELLPPPIKPYRFEELRSAHAAAHRSPRLGKIVVQISNGTSS